MLQLFTKTLIILFHVEVKSESRINISEKNISEKEGSDEDISEEDSTKFLQLSWKINFRLQNFIMKLHFICARLQNF